MSYSYLYSFKLMNLLFLLSYVHFVYVISVSFSSSSSSSKSPLCRDEESSALLAFSRSFSLSENASGDPFAYPKTDSWKHEDGNSSDCCLWDGVECDDSTGRVISLDLSSSFLYGSINSSSSLFQLTHLQKLNLADNHFNYSQIPFGIRYLSRLTYLNLSMSVFYGQFPPAIFQLPNLKTLSVSYNPLTGLLPEFNESSPLSFLEAAGTNFSGKLPYSIGNLNSLNHLDFRSSNFSGPIPSSLANLTQLEYLDLAYNDFSNGSLDWLGKQTKLLHLSLSRTHSNGCIPYSLRNMTRLSILLFDRNNLSGQIPPWFGNLTQLTVLDLHNNQLHGPIPQTFYKLVNIEHFNIWGNNLNDTVELNQILNLKNLTYIDLSLNQLSLLTSTSVNATLPRFEYVALESCNLSEFPDFLRYQYKLRHLDLSSRAANELSRVE